MPNLSKTACIMIGVILISFGFTLSGCNNGLNIRKNNTAGDNITDKSDNITDKKISIVSSFYPLAFLAERIGGPNVEVHNVTPQGVEPHDFEPDPKTLRLIYDSDIFIFNGAGLDPWAENIAANFKSKDPKTNNTKTNQIKTDDTEADNANTNILKKPVILEAADFIALQKIETSINGAIGTKYRRTSFIPKARADVEDETFDPHFWIDPVLFETVGNEITKTLVAIDPKNTLGYNQNFYQLQTEFEKLDTDFRNGLKNCQARNFVTSHAAFNYLAQRYDLNMISISGLSPDEEPGPQKLTKIVQFVKENNLRIIFSESLSSPAFVETLARETDAKILILNPVEGLTKADIENNENYFTLMQKNLENVKLALSCE